MTDEQLHVARQQRANQERCTIVIIDTPHQTVEVVFAQDGTVHVGADVLKRLAVYHPHKKK